MTSLMGHLSDGRRSGDAGELQEQQPRHFFPPLDILVAVWMIEPPPQDGDKQNLGLGSPAGGGLSRKNPHLVYQLRDALQVLGLQPDEPVILGPVRTVKVVGVTEDR